jgi:hypothetical protein
MRPLFGLKPKNKIKVLFRASWEINSIKQKNIMSWVKNLIMKIKAVTR